MNARILALAALIALSACGGGGGGSATPNAGTPTTRTGTGSVIISIPTGAAATSGHVRYPQFVSPNIQSVAVSVNDGTDQFFNVGTGSTICATSGNTRNCTLSFGAPVGSSVSFGFLVFAGANGTGATLGSASTTQPVTSQGFSFTLALNPAIGTIIASLVGNSGGCPNAPPDPNNTNAIDEGCPGHATASFTVLDPSNAVITGTTPFATPISITSNDPSVVPSPATITAPGQTALMNYSGAAFGSSITSNITVSLAVGTQIIPVMVPVLHANLYVANSNAPFGTAPTGGGNVAVYPFGASGSTAPTRIVGGTNTGLVAPVATLVDSGGFLFVLDDGTPCSGSCNPSIKVFPPGATNTMPSRTIPNIGSVDGSAACSDMKFDPTAQFLFVVCNRTILVFSAFQSTNTPAATYNWCDQAASGIGFDPSTGNLYVADNSAPNNALYIVSGPIATSGTHPLCSVTSIDGFDSDKWPSTIAPFTFAMDSSGTVYMPLWYQNATSGAPDSSGQIGIWKTADLTNNGGPTTRLTGSPFTTHAVTGAAVDYFGNLYAANAFSGTVSVFSPSQASAGGAGQAPIRTLNATGTGATTPIAITVGP